jgi:hypothetical protein
MVEFEVSVFCPELDLISVTTTLMAIVAPEMDVD